MTRPVTEPEALQELREALAPIQKCVALAKRLVREQGAFVIDPMGSLDVATVRDAESAIEAIRGAGWGPTAAHPQEDSGLTAPSPAGTLPRDSAALLDTPQIEALLAAIAPAPWVESGPDSIAEGCVYSTADGWKVCEADVIINDPDDPHGATWLPAFTLITRERGWERANANAALIAAAPDLAATSLAALTEVASLRAALREKDGLTGTPPTGDLPSHTASLAATPQHTITIGVEDGYPVMQMQCPFDVADTSRPCWPMDEGGAPEEFSASCNWKDWWENTDDCPIDDFTITCGVEVADWSDYPTFAVLAVTSGDAGAPEPTSDQAGHSGASHQETGGPEYEQVGWYDDAIPMLHPLVERHDPVHRRCVPVFRKVTP